MIQETSSWWIWPRLRTRPPCRVSSQRTQEERMELARGRYFFSDPATRHLLLPCGGKPLPRRVQIRQF